MKKLYAPNEKFVDDEMMYFYFDEEGKAHQYMFVAEPNESDDTQYIKKSDEIYINGIYSKSSEWVEIK